MMHEVTQNTLRTCEEKQEFVGFKFQICDCSLSEQK